MATLLCDQAAIIQFAGLSALILVKTRHGVAGPTYFPLSVRAVDLSQGNDPQAPIS
jgi:hypothetical protein